MYKRQVHACAHVVRAPVGLAVGRHRVTGTGVGAVRIGAPRQDVALVDMRMQIDEARQDDATAQIKGGQIDRRKVGRRRAGRRELCNARAVNDDVAIGKPVRCRVRGQAGCEVDRHARIDDAVGRRLRHRDERTAHRRAPV